MIYLITYLSPFVFCWQVLIVVQEGKQLTMNSMYGLKQIVLEQSLKMGIVPGFILDWKVNIDFLWYGNFLQKHFVIGLLNPTETELRDRKIGVSEQSEGLYNVWFDTLFLRK